MKHFNKILHYLMLFLILIFSACDSEMMHSVTFTPTNHAISKLGAEMRYVIIVPENNFYNFSSEDSILNCEGDYCKDFLVPLSEMDKLAQVLSDTTIFEWRFMTAELPYPENNCSMLVYAGRNQSTGGYNDYMCSIGNGSSAIDIIREISKSFSGEANIAFDEIIASLE
ncbi:MAG: hypothetical protein K9H26_06520 [Prolixibacteraceae bacterium]|nr:hypothetical protein [Prolixibacteraceae bacterium]